MFVGTLSNKYPNSTSVEEALDKGVDAYNQSEENKTDILKVIDACCDTEISNGNYNLLKISEVSFSSRLQDNVEGVVSSTVGNAVTGWIPVEHGKYYSMSCLYNGSRETARVGYLRMNLKLSDGTIVVYNKNAVPQTGVHSHRILNIEYENAVAVMLHFAITNENGSLLDISTADKLKAFEPMIVKGETPDEAYQNATTFEYIDGNTELPTVTKFVLKSDDRKVDKIPATPYYRNVNFGIMPFTYYQGVAPVYEQIFNQNEKYADFISAWKTMTSSHSGYVTETELGSASDGQKIYLYDFKPLRITNQNKPIPKIIIIAGQHGFEKSNIYGLYYFVDNLLNRWTEHSALEYLRNHVELMIIPVLNTYGFDTLNYGNKNGVNLNRNYDSKWVFVDDTLSSQYGGTAPFDQPETRIVRDLLANNSDALLVIDFHTNGMSAVTEYSNINWCGMCASADDYYNRMLDSTSHHLSALTAHFNLDYELNQPNTMVGHMTNSDGNGLLRGYAYENNIIGVLVEGFNGFPGDTEFNGRCYKANEEIIVNYLITAINYLGK